MTPAPKQPKLSEILVKAGAGFVLVRRPGEQYRNQHGELATAKGKEPLGYGWQKNPKTLAEAGNHAKKGGNIGLAGGAGNLILLDFDKDRAGALALWPELANTLEIYRANAPDRAKFIVRIDGPLPPSAKNHEAGIEVLAQGTQGVIVGTHDSGAVIEWRGERILTATADQVAALWRRRTGTELGAAGHRHEDAGPPDAEAVQYSMTLVERVLELAGVPVPGWKVYNGDGRKVVLERCPFNPADDPHVEDRSAAVVIGADGRIGATCHHARCQARIQAHEGGGWALLKSIAGFRPELDRQNNAVLVEALREWVRMEDFAEQVPITLQSERGYRTAETDLAAADAILDLALVHGKLEGIPLSLRRLRGGMGCGSINTAGAALARLAGWFVVADEPPPDGEDVTRARRWSIAPALRGWAAEAVANNEVAYIARILTTTEGSTTGKAQRAIYANSPLTTEKARDAFSASQTPLTRTELNARIAARDEERAALKAAGVPDDELPPRINPRRYRRRLAATLPSAGRRVLRVVDALAIHGGTLTRKQLCDLLHLSQSALSRALGRGAELGLLDVDDRHLVHLAGDWQQQVDRKEAQMPTAGRRLERAIDDTNAGLRWLEKNMHRPGLTDEQRRQMERRQAKLTTRKARLVKERFGIDIDATTAGTAGAGQPGDSRQTTAQTLASKKPRRRLTEQERFVKERFGADYAEEAEARWGRFNAQMTAEHGAGWWIPMGQEGILVEYAAWEAGGYGVTP